MSSSLADVVVPSLCRPSLRLLLAALADEAAAAPGVIGRVVVVDDRRHEAPLPSDLVPHGPHVDVLDLRVVRGRGAGPAAARNMGWRVCSADWVVFVDDDVVPAPGWAARLVADLDPGPSVVAVQARIEVPTEHPDQPDDRDLATVQLAHARWITADMAVRRGALVAVGGFDERFPRAYREDTDLALRLMDAGGRLALGGRVSRHPVRRERWTDSLRRQRGNADDALLQRLHGPHWRRRGGAPAGLRRQHVATTALGAAAVAGALTGCRRTARLAGIVWAARWWRFVELRRTADNGPLDLMALAVTSAAIFPLATGWWCWGLVRARRLAPDGRAARWAPSVPAAVLFDRDGTLVHDVPYNGDPDAVVPVPEARRAIDRLRGAGIRVGMVTNQSGVARGLLAPEQVAAVNERVASLLGPFDVVQVCPHGEHDGCTCRKPAPGMIRSAAAALGVAPARCAVVGDIGADVDAALAAGARGILVPTARTRSDEVDAAPEVAADLSEAVDCLLAGAGTHPGAGS